MIIDSNPHKEDSQMIVKEPLALLRHNVSKWNQWRQQHPEIRPNLDGADLGGYNLSGANLSSVSLIGADLTWTILDDADLSDADLSGAHFIRASLIRANLSKAKLVGSYSPTGRYLTGAFLIETNLTETNFTEAHFYCTTFVRVDLSSVKGLERAIHEGPSIVDINTVALPHHKTNRQHFLRGVGFSDALIDYLPSLFTTPIQYASCFISYAHQDQALASRLYNDLQNRDVRCWFAPHDLRPGDYHYSRIDEAIQQHEKVLLLLSEDAINSCWVKHEVQIAEAREIIQNRTILFPLKLDQVVMQTSKDWAVRLRESRHIGDFTRWQDNAAYQQSFTTLLRHLSPRVAQRDNLKKKQEERRLKDGSFI
jgi:hypothetical protein